MQKLENPDEASDRLLSEVQHLVALLNRLTSEEIADVSRGIGVLSDIRRSTYEQLNQLQHKALALDAIKWLQRNGRLDAEWSWNPGATGTADEPDVRASQKDKVLVSAEVTASNKPIGILNARMTHTLTKLGRMPGARYYFVRTEHMRKCAAKKVCDNPEWNIEVILLPN